MVNWLLWFKGVWPFSVVLVLLSFALLLPLVLLKDSMLTRLTLINIAQGNIIMYLYVQEEKLINFVTFHCDSDREPLFYDYVFSDLISLNFCSIFGLSRAVVSLSIISPGHRNSRLSLEQYLTLYSIN